METHPAATMAGLLRQVGFGRFWLANLISNLGTSAYVLAINWLTVKQHGAAGIATLALAYGLPQMLLQLVGGTMSDRLERRRLFAITQGSMLALALLILLASLQEAVPLWLLALVSGGNGILSAFDTPARTALVSELVPAPQVGIAQQLYSLTASCTAIFGPALGGVLLSLGPSTRSHEEIAFAFNALSFVPLLLCVPWLPRPQPSGSAPAVVPFRRSLREGLSYVRQRNDLRTLLALLALVMVLGMPFQGLLPVFVQRHLSAETGHSFYAALMAAVGLGSFLGSLLGIDLSERLRAGLLLAAAAAGLGVAVLLLCASNLVHWASLSAFLAGACGNLALSVDNALLQAGTDTQLQGRVNAIANLSKGLQSISLALAGYAIHLLSHLAGQGSGYQPVQVAMALALLGGVWLLWPRLQRLVLA